MRKVSLNFTAFGVSQALKSYSEKLGSVQIAQYEIDVWKFGALWGNLDNYARKLKAEGWIPDQVYVSCFQTHWWEAARDLTKRVKQKWYPNAEVFLGGVYPFLEPAHARACTDADHIIDTPIEEAMYEVPDFNLYPDEYKPTFTGIYLYGSQSVKDLGRRPKTILRSPKEIAQEVSIKAEYGVREFAFFDDEIKVKQSKHFASVLHEIAQLQLDIRFVGLGNIAPELITGRMAGLMYKAGYRQIYLKDEVAYFSDRVEHLATYEAYRDSVEALHREAKFKPRSGEVTAMLQVGNPYENVEQVSERLIKLSSIVGVVNLVQFQYSNNTKVGSLFSHLISNEMSLNELNCKFYNLARITGNPYDHYVELTRLAALLSSKYRDKTFNFLEDSLVAEAVRQSIRTKGWKPALNGTVQGEQDIIPLSSIDTKKVEDE